MEAVFNCPTLFYANNSEQHEKKCRVTFAGAQFPKLNQFQQGTNNYLLFNKYYFYTDFRQQRFFNCELRMTNYTNEIENELRALHCKIKKTSIFLPFLFIYELMCKQMHFVKIYI